jgi:hypothetical protein
MVLRMAGSYLPMLMYLCDSFQGGGIVFNNEPMVQYTV